MVKYLFSLSDTSTTKATFPHHGPDICTDDSFPYATVVQVATEGITSVIDLAEKSLQQLADNLRRPGRVPDPNPAAQPGATIATPSFILGAKSQQRLTVTTDLINYYANTGRVLTAQTSVGHM
jgi:hypothetical protein